jgi:regulator of protease activity HflC (stomatin/prohibitin superfamily)
MRVVAGGTPSDRADDLWAQITRITLRFLFAISCVVAAGWALSNVHQIPADSRAIILRLGAISGERGPGLLVAWPRPIEQVVVLPARDRQIELVIKGADLTSPTRIAGLDADVSSDARRNAEFFLTGDSGIVRLQATIFYQVTDAAAYVLGAEHIKPALRRLFAASAVAVCAARELDAIWIARGLTDTDVERIPRTRQERFRMDLVAAINRRLAALAAEGGGLGIAVSRIDLTASLPPVAKTAFDQVLTSSQEAERELAVARSQATGTTRSARQERERILAEAVALAAERRTDASTRTASIAALNRQNGDQAWAAMVNRIYYERVAALLKKAGRIDAFDPQSGARLYIPGRGE